MKKEQQSWHQMQERGSILGIRILVRLMRLFGIHLSRMVLHPVAVYFLITGRKGRAASRQYIQRLYEHPGGDAAIGHRPGLADQYRHIYSFAVTSLEQFKMWTDSTAGFEIEVEGLHYLLEQRKRDRGAILLGAHLGSFAVLRVLSQERDLPVSVVMYRENAPYLNRVLRELAPRSETRIIEYDPSDSTSIIAVQRLVEDGEFVAFLGDRTPPGDPAAHRITMAPFLGKMAPFPQGPWIIASLLGCPVFWTCGIRTGKGRYRVMARLLADQVVLPRGRREESLKKYLSAYTTTLEALCLEQPFQWFNFYDYWQKEQS